MKNKRLRSLSILALLLIGLILIIYGVSKEAKTVIMDYPYEFSTISFQETSYDVVKIEPENLTALEVYHEDSNSELIGSIENLKSLIKDDGSELIFATNGGIFSTDHSPLGLYIENGEQLVGLNTDEGNGNFYLKPNGVFLIQNEVAQIIETDNYTDSENTTLAIQSGPMLVIDDEINPAFNVNSPYRYIRSGVGIQGDGSLMFIISNQAISLHSFASFFTELGCKNALYLDGAISEMFIPTHRESTNEVFSVIIGITKE